jgi:hypothetical protein
VRNSPGAFKNRELFAGPAMGVYLPHRGKMLVLPPGSAHHLALELPDEPGFIRIDERQRPALIVPLGCDTTPFEAVLPVTEILEVWYAHPWDDLGAALNPQYDPELELRGELTDIPEGPLLLHFNEDDALEDLADCYWPMAFLLELRKGPEHVRLLVRAVLDGDQETLAVLADALEEAGHRRARAVRSLADGDPPALPPPAPRRRRPPRS